MVKRINISDQGPITEGLKKHLMKTWSTSTLTGDLWVQNISAVFSLPEGSHGQWRVCVLGERPGREGTAGRLDTRLAVVAGGNPPVTVTVFLFTGCSASILCGGCELKASNRCAAARELPANLASRVTNTHEPPA